MFVSSASIHFLLLTPPQFSFGKPPPLHSQSLQWGVEVILPARDLTLANPGIPSPGPCDRIRARHAPQARPTDSIQGLAESAGQSLSLSPWNMSWHELRATRSPATRAEGHHKASHFYQRIRFTITNILICPREKYVPERQTPTQAAELRTETDRPESNHILLPAPVFSCLKPALSWPFCRC